MAEVVVRPHDGDVLGEREARIIERKHLFIGDKDLQGLIGPFVMQDGSDDLALIGDDFFTIKLKITISGSSSVW